jgi:hypothetical protein
VESHTFEGIRQDLKDQETTKMANDICESYGKKGLLNISRAIFEKYNAR